MEDPVENVSVNTSPTEQAAAADVFGGDEAVANTPPPIPVVSEVVVDAPTAAVPADAPLVATPEGDKGPATTEPEVLSTVVPGVTIDQGTLQAAAAQVSDPVGTGNASELKVETVQYTDGTSATGTAPLPPLSPEQQINSGEPVLGAELNPPVTEAVDAAPTAAENVGVTSRHLVYEKLLEIEEHAIFWGGELGNKMRNLICEVRNLL